jgi:hypothetical protein
MCGFKGQTRPTGGLAHLSYQALGAFFNLLTVRDARHALGNIRQLDQTIRVWVTGTQVPQRAVDSIACVKHLGWIVPSMEEIIGDGLTKEVENTNTTFPRADEVILMMTELQHLVHG